MIGLKAPNQKASWFIQYLVTIQCFVTIKNDVNISTSTNQNLDDIILMKWTAYRPGW